MADAQNPEFQERLTGIVAPEAFFFGAPLALAGGFAWGAGVKKVSSADHDGSF